MHRDGSYLGSTNKSYQCGEVFPIPVCHMSLNCRAINTNPQSSSYTNILQHSRRTPELRVTIRCLELHDFKRWEPRSTHPPEVLLQISRQSAQSVSIYTCISALCAVCHGCMYTSLGHPMRYCANLFNVFHPCFVGFAIDWHASFVASWMSGLSADK